MDLQEADKIREDWGKFIETAQPQLIKKHGAEIPKSYLPHPKEKIEEAMNICIEHFKSKGDEELIETFKTCKASLLFYK